MQRLALAFAGLAAGLAAYAAYVVSALTAEVRDLRARVEAVDGVEARVAALERSREEAPRAPALVAATPGAGAHLAAGAAASSAGSATAAATVEDLQKRVESLEASAREAAADSPPLVPETKPVPLGTFSKLPKVLGSVHAAQEELGLSDAQRSDFERVVADARRELDELRHIPDADGRTWDDVQKDAFKAEDGVIRFDMSRMDAFRESTIPGRSESFGAADRRIREQAKRRMRDALTPEQRERYDQALVDPLLGGMGKGFAFSAARLEIAAPPSDR